MSAALMVGNEDEEERNIHEVDPKVEVQFESAKKRKMSQEVFVVTRQPNFGSNKKMSSTALPLVTRTARRDIRQYPHNTVNRVVPTSSPSPKK
jgi:hypothetical protein